jgi:hypothetical protein
MKKEEGLIELKFHISKTTAGFLMSNKLFSPFVKKAIE